MSVSASVGRLVDVEEVGMTVYFRKIGTYFNADGRLQLASPFQEHVGMLKIKLFRIEYRRATVTKESGMSDERIVEVFRDSANLTRTLQAGIHTALMQHKFAGNPVCEWKGNKVVWISPEDIPEKLPKKTDRE